MTSEELAELRRLLRLLRDEREPDPMLPELLEMFSREAQVRRLQEWDGRWCKSCSN